MMACGHKGQFAKMRYNYSLVRMPVGAAQFGGWRKVVAI